MVSPRATTAVLISLGFAGPALAEAPAPRFEEARVAVAPAQPHAPARIDDSPSRTFRTRLRQGAEQPVDFAGHYVLAQWGCGASCVTAAAIDVQTGRVTWLPFNVCCAPVGSQPLEYRIDSRLLIVRGSRNETGAGVYDYRLDGRRFTLLRATEHPAGQAP